MNLTEDLDKIDNNEKSYDDVIDYLVEQKNALNNQIHIFKVLKLVDNLEKFMNSDDWESYGVTLNIVYKYEENIGYYLDYEFEDSNNERYYPRELIPSFEALRSALNDFWGVSEHNLNSELKIDYKFVFNKNSYDKNLLIDNLLNEELKSILNYNLMLSKVAQKTDVNDISINATNKKNKI